jgi:WhiB family redox-sensing transcriptional regulator
MGVDRRLLGGVGLLVHPVGQTRNEGLAMDRNRKPPPRKARLRTGPAREPVRDSLLRLPEPTIEQWDWQLAAACRGMDSLLFYAPDGERSRARARRISRAKTICAGCPALNDCRDYAMSAGETWGIWGGLTEDERAPAQHLTSTG